MRLTRNLWTVTAAVALATLWPVGAAVAQEPPSSGEVVVQAESGRESQVLQELRAAGVTVVDDLYTPGAYVVDAASADASGLAQAIADIDGVRFAEPVGTMRALAEPNDTYYVASPHYQWPLRLIGMPAAWDVTWGSSAVKVAVIDTGISFTHADRPLRVDYTNDYDFVRNDWIADDEDGHGSHVAGIIAARTDNGLGIAGIAPGVTILPLKVLDANGEGTAPDVADAIRYAADQGASVINLSLGDAQDNTIVADAVDYAIAKGALVVAASGNYPVTYPDQMYFPAAYPPVVSVGSVTADKTRSSFSQYSPDLDLAAPGGSTAGMGSGVLSTVGTSYSYMVGTSQAAPHVTGVAALLRSANPTWTASDIEQRLELTAEDLGAAGHDRYFGWGMVRADRALSTTLPAPSVVDSDVPGVPLFSSPLVGSVSPVDDERDVIRLEARAGQWISLELTGTPEAELDVRLFAPGIGSVSTAVPVATSEQAGSAEKISFETTRSGTYFVEVSGTDHGTYELLADAGYSTSVNSSVASTVAWGGAASITGKLYRTGGSTPVSGHRVSVQYRLGSGSWTHIGSTLTQGDGSFTLRVKPTQRTQYRVVFPGSPSYFASNGATLNVTPKAYLTAPGAPSRVYRNKTFTSVGYIRPRHTSSSHKVVVKAYLWSSTKLAYVYHHQTVASYASYSSTTTKYTARVRLPHKGAWKLVAYVPGDTIHVATTSSARYRTVR